MQKLISTAGDIRAVAAIVASAWLAEPFKRRFVDQPKQVLSEYGVDIPGDIQVIVLEDNSTLLNVVLANKPLDPQNQIRELPPRPDYTAVLAYIHTRQIDDAAFKARFEHDPHAVFDELRYPIPAEITIKVVFDTDQKRYFALPVAPRTRMVVEMHEQNMALLDVSAADASEHVPPVYQPQPNMNVAATAIGPVQINASAVGVVVVAIVVLI